MWLVLCLDRLKLPQPMKPTPNWMNQLRLRLDIVKKNPESKARRPSRTLPNPDSSILFKCSGNDNDNGSGNNNNKYNFFKRGELLYVPFRGNRHPLNPTSNSRIHSLPGTTSVSYTHLDVYKRQIKT